MEQVTEEQYRARQWLCHKTGCPYPTKEVGWVPPSSRPEGSTIVPLTCHLGRSRLPQGTPAQWRDLLSSAAVSAPLPDAAYAPPAAAGGTPASADPLHSAPAIVPSGSGTSATACGSPAGRARTSPPEKTAPRSHPQTTPAPGCRDSPAPTPSPSTSSPAGTSSSSPTQSRSGSPEPRRPRTARTPPSSRCAPCALPAPAATHIASKS